MSKQYKLTKISPAEYPTLERILTDDIIDAFIESRYAYARIDFKKPVAAYVAGSLRNRIGERSLHISVARQDHHQMSLYLRLDR